MESWRGGKMSVVEIIVVEIVPISALYYRFHTISILQVRKLVVQVTSTSRKTCTTSYKYKYKYKLQELKNRPQNPFLISDSITIAFAKWKSNYNPFGRLLSRDSRRFCDWH